MDWYSRKVLAWRISNTLDTDFCVEALEEALTHHCRPEIFNTDQGAQFTAVEFTAGLQAHQIAISMDGKGRWMDNVFIERLWRSLKYEWVYLQAFAQGLQGKQNISQWMRQYNTDLPHSVFQGHTPDEIYYRFLDQEIAPDRKARKWPSAA